MSSRTRRRQDFKTYSEALEPGGSTSKRADKVRALLVYHNETSETPRVWAESVDDDGEETAGAADGQSVALVEALDALRAALLKK